jgi:hypothetical protein
MDPYLESMEEKDSKSKRAKKKPVNVKTPLKLGKLDNGESVEPTEQPMVCDPWMFLPRRE